MGQLKPYAKGEIAARLLETALNLYFNGGDSFAVINLAAASEELLSGMIQRQRESGAVLTAREKSIATLGEIFKIHGKPKTEKEIHAYIYRVRNKTKHYDYKTDEDVIHVILEYEVEMALFRAMDNFLYYVKAPTESMMRLVNKFQ
jgi:hypothetical protein